MRRSGGTYREEGVTRGRSYERRRELREEEEEGLSRGGGRREFRDLAKLIDR